MGETGHCCPTPPAGSLGSARRRHKMLALRPSHGRIGKFRVDCRALRPVKMAGIMSSTGAQTVRLCRAAPGQRRDWFQRANQPESANGGLGRLLAKPSSGFRSTLVFRLGCFHWVWGRWSVEFKEPQRPHRWTSCSLAEPEGRFQTGRYGAQQTPSLHSTPDLNPNLFMLAEPHYVFYDCQP
jgi:hypothetical protein